MKTTLILPDAHIPYHDERAFDLAVDTGLDILSQHPGKKRVISTGDMADMYGFSRFDKSEGFLSMRDELNQFSLYFDKFNAKLSHAHVDEREYVIGNHEKRFQKFLAKEGNIAFLQQMGFTDVEIQRFILASPELKFAKLMQLEEKGWRVHPYDTILKLGKAIFIHELGSASDGFMKNLLGDLNNHSLFVGHGHRIVQVGRTTLSGLGDGSGMRREAMMFGWLGSKKASDYKPGAIATEVNWPLAFGIGFEYPDGYWEAHAVSINRANYTCRFNGKEYKG
jgi:hypothetical protein